ncbi:hypothetical protein LTR08_005663 [Meristemomyces frigidus]|nr:hypothetical protein LTR08_005663 [Meristemomyces frigidus]
MVLLRETRKGALPGSAGRKTAVANVGLSQDLSNFVHMKSAINIRGRPLDEIEQNEYVVTYKGPEVDYLSETIETIILDSGIPLFEVSLTRLHLVESPSHAP